MSKDAETLLRFFNDNVWASIRYVHHMGYGAEANELIGLGLLQETVDVYIIAPKTPYELEKK